MTALFEYPKGAAFGKVLSKTKIYKHAKANTKIQKLFVEQVDRIVWQYKLAPETINLDSTNTVNEIQILNLHLRTFKYSDEVLRTIDKVISFPIIFELLHSGKIKTVAAYKRPSESDKTKWVVSEYLNGEWKPEDSSREPLPNALDLGGLYDRVFAVLIPDGIADGEPTEMRIKRVELIRLKRRDARRIRARLAREKQFNKQVAINAELRKVTEELKRLGDDVLVEE